MMFDHAELYEPFAPWPEDFLPLERAQAVDLIAAGAHKQAIEYGPNRVIDRTLVLALTRGVATCAVDGEGNLYARGTKLALMQRLN